MISRTYLYVLFLLLICFAVDVLRLALGFDKIIFSIVICVSLTLSGALIFCNILKSEGDDKFEAIIRAVLIFVVCIVLVKLLSFLLVKDTIVFIMLIIAIVLLIIFRKKI